MNKKLLKKSVALLMPGNNFSIRTTRCLLDTLNAFENITIDLQYAPNVYAVRNSLLGLNDLNGKYQASPLKADYVLFVDSDAVWKPSDIENLLNSAIENEKDVISAFCVVYSDNNPSVSPYFKVEDPVNPFGEKPFGKAEFRVTTNDLQNLPDIFQTKITGMHFCLINKNVFEKITYPPFHPHIYSNFGVEKLFVGEDCSFSYKLWNEAKITCWVDKRIIVGHEKLFVMPWGYK